MNIRIMPGVTVLLVSFGCSGSTSIPSSPLFPSALPTTPTGRAISIVLGASDRTTTAYAPNVWNVAVGDSVTWINNDTAAHTATADGGAWNSGSIAPGLTFSQKFATPGTFPYHCTIHPGMVGTITVQ